MVEQDRTWTAHYLTWERVDIPREVVRRPSDGWISWLMSNLWRASLPALLLIFGLFLLALFVPSLESAASLAIRPGLFEILWNLSLGGISLFTFSYWLWLLHSYPFEDSPHPEQDRALWLLLRPVIARSSHAPTLPPETDTHRRWLRVPVEISWHQHKGAPRLSWAARYIDAQPAGQEAPPEPVDPALRQPPRLGNGAVELRERGFALDLLRDPHDQGWTLELRSTRRGARLALDLPEALVSQEQSRRPIAQMERARVQMELEDAQELVRRLHLQAEICDAPRPRELAPQQAQVPQTTT